MAGQPAAPERQRAAHLGPERRRPLVLDAAMGIFLEHGFEGASMDAIAEAAGVSKPVVYDCFASKAELFKALFQREEARVMGEIRAALDVDVDGPAENALAGAYAAFLRAVADSPDAYRVVVLGEGGGNAAVGRRIRQGRERQVAAAAAAARRWLAPAEHGDRDMELFGELMIGLGEAGARALLAGSGAWTPDELAGRLAAVAVAALPR